MDHSAGVRTDRFSTGLFVSAIAAANCISLFGLDTALISGVSLSPALAYRSGFLPELKHGLRICVNAARFTREQGKDRMGIHNPLLRSAHLLVLMRLLCRPDSCATGTTQSFQPTADIKRGH